MTKQNCTFTQKIAIHERLKEEIEIISEEICKYKNSNVTDHTIAKELNVSANSVQNIRTEIFGSLKKYNKNKKNEIEFLKNEIDNSKNHIKNMMINYIKNHDDLYELIVKYNKLIDTLHFNKIANVHHLKLNKDENV